MEISIGLNQDTAPEKQPQGTYRFALNAINDSISGDMDWIMSEPGNRKCFDLPGGYEPIGQVYVTKNQTVIFSTDGEGSEIGIQRGCEYETLINAECLNFSPAHKIDAIFRQRRGCDDVIYFTDGLNPIRRINLQNLEQYYDDDELVCGRVDLFRGYKVPCIIAEVREGGGSLPVGSYNIAIQYMDRDFNPTPFIYATNSHNAITTNLGGNWFEKQGGFPDDVAGGYPNTSKSITVELENPDEEFAYWRLAVIYGDQVGYTRPIPVSTTIHTISRIDNLELGDINEVRQITADIRTAKHIAQIENRLLLGNTTSRGEDLCDLQRRANLIRVKPTKFKRQAYDTRWQEDPKNANVRASYMADEVYSFGIVWVREDGSETPVFHIPGRAGDDPDYDLLTVVNTNPGPDEILITNVAHLGFTTDNFQTHVVPYLDEDGNLREDPGQVPAFMAINTGSEDEMAYHQSNSERYPETLDCDGEPYWGDLAGKPIRHHKFPNRMHIPLTEVEDGEYYVNYIYPLFSNISIPDGYVGYYIVRGDREGQETILDKGMALPNQYDDDADEVRVGKLDSDLNNPFGTFFSIMETYTPRNLYDGFSVSEGSYFGIEGIYDSEPLDALLVPSGIECQGDLWPHAVVYLIHTELKRSQFTNVTFQDVIEIQRRATQSPVGSFTEDVSNVSYSNKVNAVNAGTFWLLDDISEIDTPTEAGYYVSVKRNIDPFNDLSAITYHRTHNCMRDESTRIVEWGDTYIAPLDLFSFYRPPECPGVISSGREALSNYRANFFVESTVNHALRHADDSVEVCESVPDFGFTDPGFTDSLGDYAEAKANPEGGDDTFSEATVCPEVYKLNPAFSRQNDIDIYLPLPNEFDCCEDCVEEFRQRIFYSEQSFTEEINDFYGIVLPQNYRDMPGNHGEITNLFTIRDRLMVHTEEMLWELPKNLQERVTEDFTTFIGTGEFFGIPPRPIADVDVGMAGSIDKWATVKTRSGVLFVDQYDGRVYVLGQELQEVSQKGLGQWFRENLKVFFPLDDHRIEVRSAYDPKYDRVLITKIDYEPLGELTYDGGYLVDGEPVEFGDPEYFRNRSWTISFSLKTGTWISWHSYLPSFYISDRDKLYSFNDGFWAHDVRDVFHEFYGKEYPHILDLISIDSPMAPQIWDAVIYQSIGRRWNGGWVDDLHATFTDVMLYNRNQCTGKLNVEVKELGDKQSFLLDAVKNETGEISVTRKERLFFMNYFRDFVVNYNERFFHDLWDDIRDEYFIDGVINEDAFDFNRSWQERASFRGDWIGARFYNTNTAVQLMSKYFIFNKIESLR